MALNSALFWFDLDDPDWTAEELDPWLSEGDRQRCARLISPALGQRQRVACALLRRLLSQWLQRPPETIHWQQGEHGKPFLAGGPYFNLSHSQGFAGLALDQNQEIGLDLEDRRREVALEQLARRFFAPPEAAWVLASADLRRSFFDCWTAKEAYIKALGSGLYHPLDQFLTLDGKGAWGLWSLDGTPLNWDLLRPACPWEHVSCCWVGPRPVQAPQAVFRLLPGGQWQPLQVMAPS